MTQLSQRAHEYLNEEYSYTNPWFMDADTVWKILCKARAGHEPSREIWNNYCKKVRLPDIDNLKGITTFTELCEKIYKI